MTPSAQPAAAVRPGPLPLPLPGTVVTVRLPGGRSTVTEVLGDDGTLLLLEPPLLDLPVAVDTRVELGWDDQGPRSLVAHLESAASEDAWTLRPGDPSSRAPEQRREYFRVLDDQPVLVTRVGLGEGLARPGRLRDLSEGGLRVRLDGAASVDLERSEVLEVQVPFAHGTERLRAEVVHVDCTATGVEAGLRFTRLTPVASRRLRSHVVTLQRRQVRSSAGR